MSNRSKSLSEMTMVSDDGVRCLLPVARGKLVFGVLLGRLEDMNADTVVLPTDGNLDLVSGKGYDAFLKKAGKGVPEEAKAYAKKFGPGENGAGVPLGTVISTNPGELKQLKRIMYANYMKPAGDVRLDEEAVEICVKNELKVTDQVKGNTMCVAAPNIALGMTLNAFIKGTWKGADGYFLEAQEKPSITNVSIVVNAFPSREGSAIVERILNKVLRSSDT